MEFVEIPRLAVDSERIISATKVRELIKSRDFNQLRDYVPTTTLDIIQKLYI